MDYLDNPEQYGGLPKNSPPDLISMAHVIILSYLQLSLERRLNRRNPQSCWKEYFIKTHFYPLILILLSLILSRSFASIAYNGCNPLQIDVFLILLLKCRILELISYVALRILFSEDFACYQVQNQGFRLPPVERSVGAIFREIFYSNFNFLEFEEDLFEVEEDDDFYEEESDDYDEESDDYDEESDEEDEESDDYDDEEADDIGNGEADDIEEEELVF